MSLSLRQRYLILERDRFHCQICGRGAEDGVTLEVDHKVSRVDGGTDDPDNLWTLCFDCNRGKGRLSVRDDETTKEETVAGVAASLFRTIGGKRSDLERLWEKLDERFPGDDSVWDAVSSVAASLGPFDPDVDARNVEHLHYCDDEEGASKHDGPRALLVAVCSGDADEMDARRFFHIGCVAAVSADPTRIANGCRDLAMTLRVVRDTKKVVVHPASEGDRPAANAVWAALSDSLGFPTCGFDLWDQAIDTRAYAVLRQALSRPCGSAELASLVARHRLSRSLKDASGHGLPVSSLPGEWAPHILGLRLPKNRRKVASWAWRRAALRVEGGRVRATIDAHKAAKELSMDAECVRSALMALDNDGLVSVDDAGHMASIEVTLAPYTRLSLRTLHRLATELGQCPPPLAELLSETPAKKKEEKMAHITCQRLPDGSVEATTHAIEMASTIVTDQEALAIHMALMREEAEQEAAAWLSMAETLADDGTLTEEEAGLVRTVAALVSGGTVPKGSVLQLCSDECLDHRGLDDTMKANILRGMERSLSLVPADAAA